MRLVLPLLAFVLGWQPVEGRDASGSDTTAPASAPGGNEVAATDRGPATAPPGPWVVGGFVDVAYQHSSNAPANHV